MSSSSMTIHSSSSRAFHVGNVPVNASSAPAAVDIKSLTLRDLTVYADFFLVDTNGTPTVRVATE